MIARIKTETGVYDSVVFAWYKKGWNSFVIVFDENYDALKPVKIWIPERRVFLYDMTRSDDWVVKKRVEGYDWVLKNISKKFFKIRINPTITDKCKELQSTVENCDWFEIKNKTDIEGLLACAVYFHDSHVEKLYRENDKQYIRFDDVWDCEILFELDGNIQTNLFENFGAVIDENGNFFVIMDSSMFIENGLIYWVDDEAVQKSSDIEKLKAYYFCANRVKWKLLFHN